MSLPRKRSFAAVLLAAVLITASTVLASSAVQAEEKNAIEWHAKPLPGPLATVMQDSSGADSTLAAFKGKVVVVNFWATWCAPCIEEMPELDRIGAEYRGRGVEVIGIGIDTLEKVRSFRDRLGIGFPLLVAGAGGSELARTLGNVAGVLPYTLLVTPSGAIEQRRIGRIQQEELKAWLDARLGPKRPAA